MLWQEEAVTGWREKLSGLFREGRVRDDFRQFLLFAFGYGIVLVLGYLVLRKINLTLSTEEMGKFSYLSGLVYVVMPVFYLAAPQAYLRFHDNHAVSPLLRRRLLPLFSLAALGIAAILWWKTGSWAALLFAAYPFFNERLFVFRAQMRSHAVNLLKVAELLVPLGVLYLLPLAGAGGWTRSAAAMLAAYGIGYCMAFVFPLRLRDCGAPDVRTLGRFLAPVALTTVVAALIENLTVVATKSLLGYEAAAQVGVATRNLIFTRALFSLLQMFYPVVYFREMKLGRHRLVSLYRALVVGVAVLFVGTMSVGAPLLYRLTGAAAYVASSPVFVILSAAMLFDFLFDTYALYFQHEIRTWKATVVKASTLTLLGVGFAVLFALGADRVSPLAFAGVTGGASLLASSAGIFWAVRAERRERRQPREVFA